MTICVKLDDIAPHYPVKTAKRRIVTGEQLMFAKVELLKGTEVAPHQHQEEQVTYVMEGKIEIIWGKESRKKILEQGDLILYDSDEPHGVKALENSVVLEAFSPPIKAYLSLAAKGPMG